jgi:hypothetical protein
VANVNNPFGFSPYGTRNGATPNFRLSRRKIASNNGTAIYTGDAVIPLSTGYIAQATASTVPMAGIFMGCEYLSVSQGNIVRSRFWGGSDANGDVTAYVIDNPDALFVVQAGSSAIPFSDLNANAQLNVGTGSSITGQSGMFIDTVGTTNTYPFIIVDFVQDPSGANGTDITTGYNWVIVGWNLEIFNAPQTSIA